VRKINNKKWIEVRKMELKDMKKIIPIAQEVVISKPFEEEILESPYQKMLNIIRNLDSGNGADYQEVIVTSGIKDSERILNTLLEEGEIFEIRPGRLKVLE
jgi:hypothetical protein